MAISILSNYAANKAAFALNKNNVQLNKSLNRLSTGKQIKVNTDTGVRHGTIIKVGKFNADVDMNHPLAGKNLHFEVEVISVCDAAEKNAPDGQPPSCGCC